MPLPFIVTTWGPCWWRGGVIVHFLVSGQFWSKKRAAWSRMRASRFDTALWLL